jgi:hypothetical protein
VILIVYADRLAAGLPADLIQGPCLADLPLTIVLQDGTRREGAVIAIEPKGTVLFEIDDEAWRLTPRPAPNVLATHATVPTEHWTITKPVVSP